ncbi:hypothetical protein BJF82_04140 [Kytococcus sp. CUA-901]|nr:hypothetical protein BJF82_04140 [Kytococcus sp. CUA-901]
MVARMRWAWTPWPSCTKLALFSRIHGMSRDSASSRMACVEGPKATRWASSRNSSISCSKSSGAAAGSTAWFTIRTANSPAARPSRSSR